MSLLCFKTGRTYFSISQQQNVSSLPESPRLRLPAEQAQGNDVARRSPKAAQIRAQGAPTRSARELVDGRYKLLSRRGRIRIQDEPMWRSAQARSSRVEAAKRRLGLRLYSQRPQGGNYATEVRRRNRLSQRSYPSEKLSRPSIRSKLVTIYWSTLPPNIRPQRQSERQAIPSRWLPCIQLEESEESGSAHRRKHLPDSAAQSGLQPYRESIPLCVEKAEGAGTHTTNHKRIDAGVPSPRQAHSANLPGRAHRPHHWLDGQAHGTHHQLKGSANSLLTNSMISFIVENFSKIECIFWLRWQPLWICNM